MYINYKKKKKVLLGLLMSNIPSYLVIIENKAISEKLIISITKKDIYFPL